MRRRNAISGGTWRDLAKDRRGDVSESEWIMVEDIAAALLRGELWLRRGHGGFWRFLRVGSGTQLQRRDPSILVGVQSLEQSGERVARGCTWSRHIGGPMLQCLQPGGELLCAAFSLKPSRILLALHAEGPDRLWRGE